MSVVVYIKQCFERLEEKNTSVELQVSYESPFTCLLALLGEYLLSRAVLEASKHIGCFLDLIFNRIAPFFDM